MRPIQFTSLILFSLLLNSAMAGNDFWQNYLDNTILLSEVDDQEKQYSYTEYQQYDYRSDLVRESHFSVTQNLSPSSTFAMAYEESNDQKNVVLGYSHSGVSLSYLRGRGKDYAQIAGDYAGIDPYLFHGGLWQEFSYDGMAVDLSIGASSHMQYGEASLRSDGLEERKTRYFEYSNKHVYARASEFSRGNEGIGKGLELGFAFAGNKQIGVQSLRLHQGRKMDRVRFQFNQSASKQFWLDVSRHNNDLFRDGDDMRVMFSFRTLLNAPKPRLYHAQNDANDTGANQEKKPAMMKRAIFIGAGVAAVAALASSGSSSNDSVARFKNEQDAAFEVLDGVNPQSVRENREYGGWVFRMPDGNHSYTEPVAGDNASVNLPPFSSVGAGSVITASYHTHAGFDPRYDNENFSPTDLELDRDLMVDGYLATPGGQFKHHNWQTNEVITIGPISN